MTLYECSFREQKERFCIDDSNEGQESQIFGNLVCDILSIDFEGIALSIDSLLEESLKKHRNFPEDEILLLLSQRFAISEFRDLSIVVSISKNLYKMKTNDPRRCKSITFVDEIYSRFKKEIVLQAYLEESENLPEMCNPVCFERFVNGGLEAHIVRQEQAISLSEYSFFADIVPGCDARSIVADIFSNLMQFNDDFIVLSISSLDDFLVTAIYYFYKNGFRFKRCKNCGRFFVPLSRSDEIYCNNESPQDKFRTCKEYGSQRLWYEKLKADEVTKLARNVYSAKQMLVRRNPDILAYKKMFDYFKSEKKRWEASIRSGEKTKGEYVKWLNEIKEKKTL